MTQLPYDGFLADMIDVRRTCIFIPHMLPVVSRGCVLAQNIRTMKAPPADMSAEDYVLGLFALCLSNAPPVTVIDGWVATRESFDGIPSRWAERAHALHRAFGPNRTREVANYLRSSGISVDLAALQDHEEVRRFATPRQAIIGCALILAMRENQPSRAELLERGRFAEPKATDEEIETAAHATIAVLHALSVQADPALHAEAGL